MNQQEAIRTIENLQTLLQSHNRVIVSPKRLLVLGIVILLVPLIEFSLNAIGVNVLLKEAIGPLGLSLSRGLFYGITIFLIGKKLEPIPEKQPHPLISKAFSIEKVFVYAVISLSAGMWIVGQKSLIYPSLFVLMGLFNFLIGKFTNKSFIWTSWVYLILAPIFFYLTLLDIPNLWMYLMITHGLSYLYVAFYSQKFDQEKN